MAKYWAPNADLVLLHAFELPYEGKLAFAGVDEQVIRRYVTSEGEVRRKRLHELAAAASLTAVEYSDQSFTVTLPSRSSPWRTVDADLLVVGKHGAHIAEELLSGKCDQACACGVAMRCAGHL